MVDKSVVKKILDSLQQTLADLKAKQTVSFEEYRLNRDIQAIVERRLETAIQACIDIGNHIIAQENLGSPSYYGEIFTILAQHKIISTEQEKCLIKMTGFRNVLIHEYREIIVEKTYHILREKLADIYDFAKSIITYLENEKLK
jgi:uncharacterized protein YutE (UPF0331/DUF86 family)